MPTFRTSDGVNLSYTEEGDGHTVVLIHGFTALAAAWALTMDALVADGAAWPRHRRASRSLGRERCHSGRCLDGRQCDLGLRRPVRAPTCASHCHRGPDAKDAEQPRLAIRFLWLQRKQRRHVLRSQIWPCEHAEAAIAANPFGRAVIIEDSGHTVSFDQPDRFHDVLLEFLRTQGETLDR